MRAPTADDSKKVANSKVITNKKRPKKIVTNIEKIQSLKFTKTA